MSELPAVIAALQASGEMSDDDLMFLAKHGRAFEPAPLPRGIKRREPGECFTVAHELARAGWGSYARGFALLPDSTKPLAHGWVSKYGAALDASWPEELAMRSRYWGITKPGHEERLRRMSRPFLKPISIFNFAM